MTLGAAGGGTCATRSVAATGRRNGAEAKPSEERAPEARRQPRRQQEVDPARLRRHRLLPPDRGELADRRLRRSHGVVEEARLGEQRLRGGIGEHQVDRLAADRERRRGRRRELVRLRAGARRCRRRPGSSWPRARPARTPPRRPTLLPGARDGRARLDVQDRLHLLASGGLLGGEIRGEAARDQRRDGRGGERHRRDVDQGRGHRLAELREDGRRRARRRPCPPRPRCRPRVGSRRPCGPAGRGATVGRSGRRGSPAYRSPAGRAPPPARRGSPSGAMDASNAVSTSVSVRIERGRRGHLDRRREEQRHLGCPHHEDHRRVDHGDL